MNPKYIPHSHWWLFFVLFFLFLPFRCGRKESKREKIKKRIFYHYFNVSWTNNTRVMKWQLMAYIVVVCWGKKTNSSEYSVITLIIIIILMKKASISTLDQLTNIWFDLILCTMDSLCVCVHVCGCCWVWGKWEARATSYKTKFIDGSESGMTALFFSLSFRNVLTIQN